MGGKRVARDRRERAAGEEVNTQPGREEWDPRKRRKLSEVLREGGGREDSATGAKR